MIRATVLSQYNPSLSLNFWWPPMTIFDKTQLSKRAFQNALILDLKKI